MTRQLVDAWYQLLGLAYAGGRREYAKAVDAYRLTLERSPAMASAIAPFPWPCAKPSIAARAWHEAQNCLAQLPTYAGAWNLIRQCADRFGGF